MTKRMEQKRTLQEQKEQNKKEHFKNKKNRKKKKTLQEQKECNKKENFKNGMTLRTE